MATLLGEQTSRLLGIDPGAGVGSFTERVTGAKKARPTGVTTQPKESSEAKAEATAHEAAARRLLVDPKKTHGATLKLTTKDAEFIRNVKDLNRKIFKGGNELGKNATEKLKGQVRGLIKSASQSSRGGLEDIWSETFERIQKQGGRTAPGGLSKLQAAYNKALQATNKVLDTSVDLKTYQFEEPEGEVLGKVSRGREKQFARSRKKSTTTPTNFWENPEYRRLGIR